MQSLPLRLSPGVDLRGALEEVLASQSTASAAFVIAGIGSLVDARLRFAGEPSETTITGPLEIVTLSGTLTPAGAHLHMSVSDASGRVYGGHVGRGNVVRTTAEILLGLLPEWDLTRDHDALTGFSELVVRGRAS